MSENVFQFGTALTLDLVHLQAFLVGGVWNLGFYYFWRLLLFWRVLLFRVGVFWMCVASFDILLDMLSVGSFVSFVVIGHFL